ncbi:MAG: dihydrolipoyl dehydrogenase [Thiobacillus sp. 65-69]|nr:dihydrolipoyl dehydrogenase [Thiobacillus sp.]ODU87587.1 MAG: dihydrolipoyl dehydrogenase [Thiobacillus sp. SCN 65-179]OJW38816.1 MAG: dihydrolipoyl dehydrogenase [Thiobacillus sp. 65-69]
MTKHIAIVGGGPAGYVAASHAAAEGARVTLIDPAPLGGTCLHRGCIPTKTLVEVCNLLDKMRRAESYGIRVSGPVEADWPGMRNKAGKVIGLLNTGINSLMADRRVVHMQGRGRILDGRRVEVSGHGVVEADAVLVSTGSTPILPDSFAVDPVRVATSDDLLQWDSLPKTLLIVGDGVVACEFAFIMNTLGVAVTMVAMGARPLPFIDSDISAVVQREMRRRGIQFIGNCAVEGLVAVADGIAARTRDKEVASAERALVAIGRRPNTHGLGLDAAGVALGPRGAIATDAYMQTNLEGLYAVGDVNGRLALAHAASAQARSAVDHALGVECAPLDESIVPWAVFTMPEIGCVGMTEQRAIESGHAVSVGKFDLRGLGKAQAMSELTGMAKVVADRISGRLLGVHIIGAHASDMVHEAAVLLRQNATVHAITQTVHAHPTLSEAIQEAAEDALGQAVHKPMKNKAAAPAPA